MDEMAPQKVVRVDDASYAAMVAYRPELQRRTGCKVSLSRALRELLMETARRLGLVEAQDQRADQRL